MKTFQRRILSLFIIFFLLSSCTVITNVQTKEGFDFKSIQTYSIFPRNSEFVSLQELSDFQRNRIELAIERAMESQQFQYADYNKADVVVSYFWAGRNFKALAKYNDKVKACIRCSKFQKEDYNRDIRASSLIIDVLDNKTYRTVYRNSTVLELRGKNNSEENQEIIMETVTDLLSDLSAE